MLPCRDFLYAPKFPLKGSFEGDIGCSRGPGPPYEDINLVLRQKTRGSPEIMGFVDPYWVFFPEFLNSNPVKGLSKNLRVFCGPLVWNYLFM